MSVQKVSANGAEFAIRLVGPANAPVVMMAHAMGTSMRIWDAQIEALQTRYRVLAYDWRGHGDTGAVPGPYSLEQFNADAVGVMDALNIKRVHFIGISTGGMIGQGLGIEHGDRLHSLTLCNTISLATAGYREWVEERHRVLRERGMDAIWDMTKALWFNESFIDADSAAYRRIRDVFVATDVRGYIDATSAVRELAWRDRLGAISVPTHIIAAGDDPVTPPDPQSREIHERIPGATYEIIRGQRHFSNVEVPETFNRLLLRFLARVV